MVRDDLLAVVVVDGDGVDRTGAGRELRVQFVAVGHVDGEHVVPDRVAVDEHRLPGVRVFVEAVAPFRDTLEHPDAGVPVEFDSHTRTWTRRVYIPAGAGPTV